MQIAYASQRSNISFYISMVFRQDYRIFFFSFKLFFQSVAGVLFSTVKFLYKSKAGNENGLQKGAMKWRSKKSFFKCEVSTQMLSTCTKPNLVVSGNSRAQVTEQILSISPIRKFRTREVYCVKLEPRILSALKPRPRLAKVAAHLAGIMQFLPLTHSWVNSKHSSPSCLRFLCMYPTEA